MTTIIIGAGMAGLACARHLVDCGETVIVLDKGRGLGGRLATRRTGEGAFDHGAQYVTARDAGFAAWLDQAASLAAAAPWQQLGLEQTWWVGTPGMSKLTGPLAEGLDIRKSCRVETVQRSGKGWALACEGGGTLAADRLGVAIPAPQAAALLTGVTPLADPLDTVRYAPCWTLMVSLAEPLGQAPRVYRASDGPCAWVACNSTKPGRSGEGENWVIQAGPGWSESHLEEDPETVTRLLLDAFSSWSGGLPEIRLSQVHRWRHARVLKALEVPCLWDVEARIGLAGDWCLGPRVEAAYLSGRALAGQMMAAQSR
ncbi:NAD(P)/FAD-dependent oxidoreductase [Maricaulis sp.]|uniref:NAD(P)/FAD-dependent oxidoreductase n=1 Tax=Maricaulis sp. TaxID=1486257 RepID=UPI002B277ECF|nr:FAD-dependent oxidoreductase [Maricaulis sp.]